MSAKTSVLFVFCVLVTGLLGGWLIFGVRGRPGDAAIGFLLGVLATLFVGMVLGGRANGAKDS